MEARGTTEEKVSRGSTTGEEAQKLGGRVEEQKTDDEGGSGEEGEEGETRWAEVEAQRSIEISNTSSLSLLSDEEGAEGREGERKEERGGREETASTNGGAATQEEGTIGSTEGAPTIIWVSKSPAERAASTTEEGGEASTFSKSPLEMEGVARTPGTPGKTMAEGN